jgi:hypothetical protein
MNVKVGGTYSYQCALKACFSLCLIGPTTESQDSTCKYAKQKAVVEWLALLLLIREVPGSNLGPETDYPDSGLFVAFISPSRQNFGIAH